MDKERLRAFARAPGLASHEDVTKVEEFLLDFQKQLAVFRSAYGEPTGLTVQSILDGVAFYFNRSKNISENS